MIELTPIQLIQMTVVTCTLGVLAGYLLGFVLF